MSGKPFAWGHEHFCAPDATALYNAEPDRLNTVGYPVELDTNPEPPTFCSICLLFFDDPDHTEGSDHRPPQKGTTNG